MASYAVMTQCQYRLSGVPQPHLEQGPSCIFVRTLRLPVLGRFPCFTFSAHAFTVIGVMLSDNSFSTQTYRYFKELLPARHDAGAFLMWVA